MPLHMSKESPIATLYAYISSHHIQALKSKVSVYVPTRIKERWPKCPSFCITKALQQLDVSPKIFQACWKQVQPKIRDDELFALLKEAFNGSDKLNRRVDFIKEIFRRYKVIEDQVCPSGMPVFFPSVLCIQMIAMSNKLTMSHT